MALRTRITTPSAWLLWTLEQGLGAAWTPDAAVAWKEGYGLLSSIMRNAQQAASAKAAA